MKSGIWFSQLAFEGNDVILTHKSEKQDISFSISLKYLKSCLFHSNNLLEDIASEMEKYYEKEKNSG